MIERLRLALLFVLAIAFFGCEIEENTDTYFGGKIINPKSDSVVLFFQETPIDTFLLDENNSFLSKVKIKKEGLFYFKHGPEHQYVFLQPQDSLLIRLNTWNFDESLVFSGRGADRNNMLIDCFIDAEKDEKKFFSLYKLNPKDFKVKIHKMEAAKTKQYKQFLIRNQNETKQFKQVLKMALTYPLYSKVENYPFVSRATTFNTQELDSSFYTHRNKIELKKDSIMYFYAYRDFIMSHLYNSVFSEGYDMNSDDFTVTLLGKIDEHFTFEKTKNALLRQTTIGHFYRKSSCDIENSAFETFFKTSTNVKDKELVSKLINDINFISKGKKIVPFSIVDHNHKQHSITSIINQKNSVVYFWNPVYMSKEYVASKINYLTKKYPSVNFIGVKIYDGKLDRIQKLDIKSQFYLDKNSVANHFLTSSMPRTLLINKEGVVINGFASLSSQNIYKQIRDLAQY